MYQCPACKASTISLFRKWLSYPTLPAHCAACSAYSHAHRSSGGIGVVVAAVVITAGGIAASALQAVWPLLCGIAAASAFYFWRLHQLELEPLSPELVSQARKTEAMGSIALILALIFG